MRLLVSERKQITNTISEPVTKRRSSDFEAPSAGRLLSVLLTLFSTETLFLVICPHSSVHSPYVVPAKYRTQYVNVHWCRIQRIRLEVISQQLLYPAQAQGAPPQHNKHLLFLNCWVDKNVPSVVSVSCRRQSETFEGNRNPTVKC